MYFPLCCPCHYKQGHKDNEADTAVSPPENNNDKKEMTKPTPIIGITTDNIKSTMDLALDWFMYDNSNWVVYSNSSVDMLVSRFRPLTKQNGRLFICELNLDSTNGLMDQAFWDWLSKSR